MDVLLCLQRFFEGFIGRICFTLVESDATVDVQAQADHKQDWEQNLQHIDGLHKAGSGALDGGIFAYTVHTQRICNGIQIVVTGLTHGNEDSTSKCDWRVKYDLCKR